MSQANQRRVNKVVVADAVGWVTESFATTFPVPPRRSLEVLDFFGRISRSKKFLENGSSL